MSDEELIARLRSMHWCVTTEANGVGVSDSKVALAAADRIEALTKERDEADDLAKAAFANGASNNIRLAETSYRVKWLEAKLAKAVEAAEQLASDAVPCVCNYCLEARATLAEIKGESHD